MITDIRATHFKNCGDKTSVPRRRLGVTPNIGVRAKGEVERGFPGGGQGRAGQVCPADRPLTPRRGRRTRPELSPGQGRRCYTGVHRLGRPGVRDPVKVGLAGDFTGPSANNVEFGGRHFDRTAGGH